MCLAIPGKILREEDLGFARTGRVQFGGIVRQVRLDFVPEAVTGDYVLVHVGFAISKIDEEEAHRTYQLLGEMGALQDELPPEDGAAEPSN
jgi:hydrogenase expression/formation protein HypC